MAQNRLISFNLLSAIIILLVMGIVNRGGHCVAPESTEEYSYVLNCRNPDEVPQIRDLDNSCWLLKLFNQTELDRMDLNEQLEYAKHCACQLTNMGDKWYKSFDKDDDTRRLYNIVWKTKNNGSSKAFESRVDDDIALVDKLPDFFWNDIDVTVNKVSIYTATTDFFHHQVTNSSLKISGSIRHYLDANPMWNLVRRVCRKVVRDPYGLYQYMENLNRINSLVFLQLIRDYQYADMIYTASKACKILIKMKFDKYKLRPDNPIIVPVSNLNITQFFNGSISESKLKFALDFTGATEDDNTLPRIDLDKQLQDASVLLLNCEYMGPKLSISELQDQCPLMTLDEVQESWLFEHAKKDERSQLALNCGCQLLKHNDTWAAIMQDPNVKLMSSAITTYLNYFRVPHFADTPRESLFAWFNNALSKFTSNRKMSVKQIVKVMSGDEDPLKPIGREDMDKALEILRRGCNLIMFNYNKGSKFTTELKLIKYLDRLQLMSQDPMFVFSLTLQDPNLFKLHALSKMCIPVVR